ncbi:MAG: hypothetical protein QM727_02620 [Niabella sp.]
MLCKRRYLLLCLFILSNIVHGQTAALPHELFDGDSIADDNAREKIFLHYDKPYYRLNDTIWLKGYALRASDHVFADSAGIAYIEIINEESEVLKRASASIYFGLFNSCIALPKDDFKQGAYILRAYTNWMRNFGDSLFFESRFKIIDAGLEQWKADVKKISFANHKFELYTTLKDENAKPLAYTDVRIRLRAGLRNFLRVKTTTDNRGNIYIDTLLKNVQADKNMTLEILSKDKIQLSLPVKNLETPPLDVQFLPEGGHCVAGIQQRIGFKAIDMFGKGVAVSGHIKDSKGNIVTPFKSVHNGMGIISMTPSAGESYVAGLDSSGMVYPLPAVKTSGTVLQIINPKEADSIVLKIIATPIVPAVFYFAGRSRGVTYAGGRVNLTKQEAEVKLAKTLFPQGVTRFVLYDKNMHPLNERATFIWHDDEINISVHPHKEQYVQKDRVSLQIRAQDMNTTPLSGNFSMAVLDTTQVKYNQDMENILSYMLLSSDLKGKVEEPYFYIRNPYSEATDALMLTQGWVSYDWKMPEPVFEKEQELVITGKATNIFNKPLAGVNVALLGKVGSTGSFIMDTVTNDKGYFTFKNFPYFFKDSVGTVLRALNKKSKSFNVGIELVPRTFPAYNNPLPVNWQENILFDTVFEGVHFRPASTKGADET